MCARVNKMHSSISRHGQGNECYADYAWAGGCNARTQHQDDGSCVLNCCAGPDGKPIFDSKGSETLAIKAPGALQVAVGNKAETPPTIPPGGHQISSQLRGVYVQLGEGQRTGKNYIASVQYERVSSGGSEEGKNELVGSWTYFPQREDDWYKLTSAADMRRVPHSFAPGNISAALDILADRLVTVQQAASFSGDSLQKQQQHQLVDRSVQKKLPPALKKFHTMKASVAAASSVQSIQSISGSSSSFAGTAAPAAAAASRLTTLFGAPIQLNMKQVHTLRVPVAGSSLGGFSVTLLRVPSTASNFQMLKISDAAFTWRRDSSSGEVLHTSLAQHGMWVRHGGGGSGGGSDTTTQLLCCAAPTLVSGSDSNGTLKVKALAIRMQGTSKLTLQGCIVSAHATGSLPSNGVCLSGFIETIFIGDA